MKKMLLFSAVCCCVFLLAFDVNGQWTQKANVGGSGRTDAVAFSIGTKGYIGTGYAGTVITNDFWEYDPSTNAWSQKANFGGTARHKATGFSIGSKGYIGTGATSTAVFLKDFWEYDPSSNAWTQKTNFGGTARQNAVGFSIGTKGYIGTGYEAYDLTSDFWEYDPSSNAWTQKTSFGGGDRVGAVGFSIGTKGYIGTGQSGNPGDNSTDFWEYNQSTNAWSPKTSFPGIARVYATGFSIDTKGYIGTGQDYTGGNFHSNSDFWEYNQTTNTWLQKAGVSGGARENAVGFSIGTKGYIGTGFIFPSRSTDFREYTPPPALTIGSLGGTFFCTETGFSVPYTSDWVTFNSGNLFSVQLSNASGSFASPISIGATYSTASSGTIIAGIPENLPGGTGYRMRIVSTNPAVTGTDNGTNLTMSGPFGWYGDIWTSGDQSISLHEQDSLGSIYVCENTSVYFKINGATTQSQYSLDGGTISGWGWNNYPGYVNFYMAPGTWAVFKVSLTAANGCSYNLFFAFEAMSCFQRYAYKVAPNPVGSELILYADADTKKQGTQKLSDQFIQQIIIQDKFGNQLRRQSYPLNTKKIVLNVNGLAPDVYVARVYNGKEWTSVKFMKQ
jgi:hypothetical protein